MTNGDHLKPTTEATTGETPVTTPAAGPSPAVDVLRTSLGSGLLAKQPTPDADEHVTVVKVCPQCNNEYETADRFCPKDGAPLRPRGGGDPMIGRVIADRYLILARLGEGGMGRVYAAEHVKMNRQCAIKVMSPSLINDAESTTRFAREASNAARILHPNVAAVFDFGESDKTVYLVMEYVDGESLSSLISREAPLAPRRAIDIARQVADGLSAAHELGLIHRDLKPDNVIVSRKRDGREIAKVVDFGIAKAVSDAPQDALTRSGLVIGTPEFMSPEQLLGDPVDARTDLYALGCMLYQMLTGAKPFEADTREQMIRRRLHEPPPHVRDQVPTTPKRLDTLIAHMLARSPNDRIATAAEVSAALDPALIMAGWTPPVEDPSSPSSSREPTLVRSGPGAPTVTRESDPTLRPTVRMKVERPNATRVAVGALIGSVVLFAGLFAWRQQQSARDAAAAQAAAVKPPVSSPALDTTHLAAVTPPESTKVEPPKPVAAESTPATPAKKRATVARDTSAKPASKAAPAPAASADEAAIHDALDRLATAMGNGKVAILNVFPGMPPTLLASVDQLFATADKVRARPTQGDPTIIGDRAEVPLRIRFEFARRGSTVPETFVQAYTATLTKRAAQWEITGLSLRQ